MHRRRSAGAASTFGPACTRALPRPRDVVPAARPSVPAARPSLPRARRSPPPPPSRDHAARLPPLRPGRRGPGAPPLRPGRRAFRSAAPSTPATPIRPGTSRRTCRRRLTRRRSTPPAAPSARRATPPAGRTRAARLPPFRRTASRLLPAAAGQHASLPSGAPHRDFSLRLLVRRPFSLVSLPRFSLILLPPVLSQAGSTLLWPRNRRQLARDEFAPLSTN